MGYPNKNKFNKISDLVSNLSANIHIPKLITDRFRTQSEVEERLLNPDRFDSLDVFFEILKNRFLDIKNSLSAIDNAIDRNNLRIDELEIKKNNKISFLSHSIDYTNPDSTIINDVLKQSLTVNTDQVVGVIAEEDSGIVFTEIKEDDKNFIKIDLDDSKINGIKFISEASVQVQWNPRLNAYEILQNDIFQYNSIEPETEITINHNLGTRGLDIKMFKLDPNDVELRYPISTGIEYPNDDQVKIYLTSPQLISVLITRL